MTRNTGTSSQKAWESTINRLGKRACFIRLVDASEIRGRTGKVAVSAQSQPSDYILVQEGRTIFAEVKSTSNPTSFPFSMLRTTQIGHAVRITAARGNYVCYIHSLALGKWFEVPFEFIRAAKDVGRGSLKWSELTELEWKIAL